MNHPSAIAQQLALMQLADSFFPSGSFTLSHGLEYLVQAQQLRNADDLHSFLQLLLRQKVGVTDLVALGHAYQGSARNDWQAVCDADAQLFAQTLIEKTRITQRQSGRALLMVASATWQHPQLERCNQAVVEGQLHCLHPVIFAVVGQVAGLSQQDTQLAFLHSLVTGLLGAAIRLGVVGHVQAQQVRLRLHPDLAVVCDQAAAMTLDEMWSCTPLLDLAQMRHQKMARRLFAS